MSHTHLSTIDYSTVCMYVAVHRVTLGVMSPALPLSRPPVQPTNGDVFICLPFANQPVNNCQQGVTMPIFNYSISFAFAFGPEQLRSQRSAQLSELLHYTLYESARG